MYSKICLDTAPIIYFLENNPQYALPVQRFILQNATMNAQFITSVVTNVEYLPKPMIEGKQDFVLAYNYLKTLLGLKPLDSVHLATAIFDGCDAFLTNDRQLKQISEVPVIFVEDLK